MSLILFGFKGSGKTYFGKLVAQALKLPFIDTDDLLASNASELYRQAGEERFRALEKNAILQLKKNPPSVISLGGGAVLDPENILHLQSIGTLVYLDAPFELLKNRIQKTPAFATRENLETHYLKRKPLYESIPAKKIKIDRFSNEEILTQLKLIWKNYGF